MRCHSKSSAEQKHSAMPCSGSYGKRWLRGISNTRCHAKSSTERKQGAMRYSGSCSKRRLRGIGKTQHPSKSSAEQMRYSSSLGRRWLRGIRDTRCRSKNNAKRKQRPGGSRARGGTAAESDGREGSSTHGVTRRVAPSRSRA